MFKTKISQFLFALLVFVSVFSFTPKVFAFTLINTDITENTTWTQSQSPYVVESSITILANTTLTIEPGVIVKFNSTGLSVFGSIHAEGTDAEPIYFTSYYDDEVAPEIDDEEFCYEDIDEEGNELGEVCETYDLGD